MPSRCHISLRAVQSRVHHVFMLMLDQEYLLLQARRLDTVFLIFRIEYFPAGNLPRLVRDIYSIQMASFLLTIFSMINLFY